MRISKRTATSLPGVHAPAAGFDEPFAMLAACHERVARSLQLLSRLLDHLDAHGCDAQARGAAQDVWRYFELAAPAHHADEELHVLPRLRASGDASLVAAAEQIEADHASLRGLWGQLGPRLQSLAQSQPSEIAPHESQQLRALAQAFIAVHDGHLPLEDRVAFPAAQPLIGPPELAAMGQEMARRRQIGD